MIHISYVTLYDTQSDTGDITITGEEKLKLTEGRGELVVVAELSFF